MKNAVLELIRRGDERTLDEWLRDGRIAAVPESETAEFGRLAARLGRCGMLRRLCEACHGMSFAPAEDGRTLLHEAALSGSAETIRFAAEVLGYDPLQGDDRGITPMELAAGEEAKKTLEELAGVKLSDCYRNPVMRGFRPDPSILRHGEYYYIINSSFAMLPALPISRSKDLVHWEDVGAVFTDPETAALTGVPGGYGYWAPDLSHYEGRFWAVATLRLPEYPFRLQMITSAERVEGPWDAPRFLPIDGIDPSLFTDDDGRRYMAVNPGVRIVEISKTGDMIGTPRLIWQGVNRRKSEGPHILKKDGWYYIIQAEGGTGSGHMITCSRARALYGPYTACPFNPILGAKRDSAYIGRGGHGKPVRLHDGRWAIPYLCGRRVEGKTLMGRETALDPITWTADGWPMINDLKGPSCLQKKPLPDAPVNAAEPWICPRADYRTFARFGDRQIALEAGRELHHMAEARLLLHRQREENIFQQAQADVSGLHDGGMAGLVGYYDENSYYFLALRRAGNAGEIVLIQHVGTETEEETLGAVGGLQATLRIAGTGLSRRACCEDCGSGRDFRVEYLTDEGYRGGKRFTGATLGLAAVGEGTAFFRAYEEKMTDHRQTP